MLSTPLRWQPASAAALRLYLTKTGTLTTNKTDDMVLLRRDGDELSLSTQAGQSLTCTASGQNIHCTTGATKGKPVALSSGNAVGLGIEENLVLVRGPSDGSLLLVPQDQSSKYEQGTLQPTNPALLLAATAAVANSDCDWWGSWGYIFFIVLMVVIIIVIIVLACVLPQSPIPVVVYGGQVPSLTTPAPAVSPFVV